MKRLSIFYQNKEAQHLTRTDYVNDVLAALITLGFEVYVCVRERGRERERKCSLIRDIFENGSLFKKYIHLFFKVSSFMKKKKLLTYSMLLILLA